MRWITHPPSLDRYEIGVRVANTPTGRVATVTATGYSDRKRGALWIVSETLPADHGPYAAHDYVSHICLVCMAERPFTQQQMDSALVGGRTGNEDPTLF